MQKIVHPLRVLYGTVELTVGDMSNDILCPTANSDSDFCATTSETETWPILGQSAFNFVLVLQMLLDHNSSTY